METVVRPRGPYSLWLATRLVGDATRVVRDGVLTVARCSVGGLKLWCLFQAGERSGPAS